MPVLKLFGIQKSLYLFFAPRIINGDLKREKRTFLLRFKYSLYFLIHLNFIVNQRRLFSIESFIIPTKKFNLGINLKSLIFYDLIMLKFVQEMQKKILTSILVKNNLKNFSKFFKIKFQGIKYYFSPSEMKSTLKTFIM